MNSVSTPILMPTSFSDKEELYQIILGRDVDGNRMILPFNTLAGNTIVVHKSFQQRVDLLMLLAESAVINNKRLVIFDWFGEFHNKVKSGPRHGEGGSDVDQLLQDKYASSLRGELYTYETAGSNSFGLSFFTPPPKDLDYLEQSKWIAKVIFRSTQALGYRFGDQQKIHAYLKILMSAVWDEERNRGHKLNSFTDLLTCIEEDQEIIEYTPIKEIIKKKPRIELINRINQYLQSHSDGDSDHIFGLDLVITPSSLKSPNCSVFSLAGTSDIEVKSDTMLAMFKQFVHDIEAIEDQNIKNDIILVISLPDELGKDRIFHFLVDFFNFVRYHEFGGICFGVPSIEDISNVFYEFAQNIRTWFIGRHNERGVDVTLRKILERLEFENAKVLVDNLNKIPLSAFRCYQSSIPTSYFEFEARVPLD